MQFNQIGKLTPRFVALKSIDVIAEPFSLGKTKSNVYRIIMRKAIKTSRKVQVFNKKKKLKKKKNLYSIIE